MCCTVCTQAKWVASREGGALKDPRAAGSNLKFDAMMHADSGDEADSDSDDEHAVRSSHVRHTATSTKQQSKSAKGRKKASEGGFMVRDQVKLRFTCCWHAFIRSVSRSLQDKRMHSHPHTAAHQCLTVEWVCALNWLCL